MIFPQSPWTLHVSGCMVWCASASSDTPYRQISFVGRCRYRASIPPSSRHPCLGCSTFLATNIHTLPFHLNLPRLWLFPPPLTTGQRDAMDSLPTATNSRTDFTFCAVGTHIVSSLSPVLKGKPQRGGCFPPAQNLRTIFASPHIFMLCDSYASTKVISITILL